MAEPRKNHLNIDGGQVKEDDRVATYKPLPDADAAGFRSSKASLHKSKEKVDEAEEKLLQKDDEAKIVTRVDMADAKYVVGDHRNGDAKIELDANKKQFSGLTKEELLKYADDPFWVRLRWCLFILFWALWLSMLAGAIAIIVRAPKCSAPSPKTWYEEGPLIDASFIDNYEELEAELPLMRTSQVAGVFTAVCHDSDAFNVLEDSTCIEAFKKFVAKAKEYSVKVIVDLTANFVSKTHEWFAQSENRTGEYTDYFIWADSNKFDSAGAPEAPNNWKQVVNGSAWTLSAARGQFYLHQLGAEKPDLNYTNPIVVRLFDSVIKLWMQAGAHGVRLNHARHLLVNPAFGDANEVHAEGKGSTPGAGHDDYAFYRHTHTVDQPGLDPLLMHWATIVAEAAPPDSETMFTLAEGQLQPELFLLGRELSLRPPAAAPLAVAGPANLTAARINQRLKNWPALQLTSSEEAGPEVAAFAMLLPAAPVLALSQLRNESDAPSESFSHVVSLRQDASVAHGNYSVQAVPAHNTTEQMIAVARWKKGHTGYLCVFNPSAESLRGDVSGLPSVHAELTVHRVSESVRSFTNYTRQLKLPSSDILVPAMSSVVFSYVPRTVEEK